jgi:hypothetical protein
LIRCKFDTPYSYKDVEETTPTIQVDSSFNPFSDDKINKHYSSASTAYRKPEVTTGKIFTLDYIKILMETKKIASFLRK